MQGEPPVCNEQERYELTSWACQVFRSGEAAPLTRPQTSKVITIQAKQKLARNKDRGDVLDKGQP